MPKAKTHKGMMKRIKVTGRGKVTHKRCGSSHLNSSKTGNQTRKLRTPMVCPKAVTKVLERTLRMHLTPRED